MQSFSISCTTCKTRLKVRDAAAIGKLLDCPKCGAFVLVEPPPEWSGPEEGNFQTTVVAEMSSSSGQLVLAPPVASSVAEPPVTVLVTDSFVSGPPTYEEFPTETSTSQEGVDDGTLPAEPPAAESQVSAPPVAAVAAPTEPAAPDGPTKPVERPTEPIPPQTSFLAQWLVMGAAALAGVVLAFGLFVFAIWIFAGKEPTALAANPAENPAKQPIAAPAVPKTPSPVAPAKTPAEPVKAPAVTDTVKKPAEPEPGSAVTDPPEIPEPPEGPAKLATPETDVSTDPKPVEPIDPKTVSSALQKFAPFLDDALLPGGPAPGEAPAVKPSPAEPDPAATRPDEPARVRPEPRKIDISARLADKLSHVEFTSVPLVDFLQFATDLSTLPMTLDPEALQSAGITPDRPITVNLRDASVGAILKAALAPLGLAYETTAGGLVVVRLAPTDGKPRNYVVTDLTENDPDRLEALAALAVTLVAPESWSSAGGSGTLAVSAEKGALVVTQSEAVHFQMVLFCEKLRVARGLAPKSKYNPSLFRLEPRASRAASKLATPITLNFSQPAPLVRILDRLGKTAGVRILVDWQSAAEAGWSPDAEGTVVADKKPLADTLTALLKPMDLDYRVVDEGVLQVVSKQTFDARPELEFYAVADLFVEKQSGDRLAERIKAALGEEHFPEPGPGGAMRFDATGKCLLVSLPQPKQIELARLLSEWRTAK